nr:unnamed protein product [Callosobruchus analis]
MSRVPKFFEVLLMLKMLKDYQYHQLRILYLLSFEEILSDKAVYRLGGVSPEHFEHLIVKKIPSDFYALFLHVSKVALVDNILDKTYRERQRIENLTAGWDDPTQVDWGTEDAIGVESAELAEKRSSVPLLKCTALYSYTAQHPDELTIVENEQLEVVGEGDGDGWLRARNYRGEEGFVPQNYLDIERDPPVTSASGTPALVNQISFSSVDYTVDNDDMPRQAETATQSPEQISVISTGKGKEKEKEEVVEYCIAMYDYDGEGGDDELTFEEGQVIRILSRQAHSVDDGWWRGELEGGKTGNFPSLVVEECNESGELLEDPEWDEEAPLSTPPVVPQWSGVPPDVVPSLPPDEADGMDTLEDDILSSPPQQPPPAPPPEVLEELAAIEAMEAMDDSPIQNGYSYDDAFTEESPITKPQTSAVAYSSQSSSSASKAPQPKQQGFEMKMTRDQHHQYGSQFEGGQASEIPMIDVPCVEVVDESAKTSSEVPASAPTQADDVDKTHTETESKRQSDDIEEMAASTTDDHQNFAVSSSTGSDGETTGPSTAENSISPTALHRCPKWQKSLY